MCPGRGQLLTSPARGRCRGALFRPVIGYLVAMAMVVLFVFTLPRAVPGDPLAQFLNSEDLPLSPEERAQLVAYYGLDRPLVSQFGHYMSGLGRGDLGISISYGGPVTKIIGDRLPWTLLLTVTALAVSSLLSFTAGVDAAWRRGTLRDRRLLVVMTGLHGIPDFVFGIVLLIVLGVVLPIFPLAGAQTPFRESEGLLWKLGDIGYHLVLPVTALTLGLLGTKFLLVRNATISVLGQDYMVAARAKGLPERLAKYRHAGRNSLMPFLAVLGIQIGFAFGGSLFIETIFGYPGLASVLQKAVGSLDYPLLEGCFLILAVIVLTANLLVDLLSATLDPRIGAE